MAREVLLIAEARIATVQLLEQVLAHLEETAGLRVRSRLLDDLASDDLADTAYPLIVRSFTPEALRLARLLTRRGAHYGFYLDDNFWLLDPESEIGRVYSAKPQRRRLERMVRGASPVIASTPLLRDYIAPLNDNVIQLDSFFDFSLVPTLPPPPAERPFLRGGFAASAHRGRDLEPVIEAVMDVLDRHENVEFELIGIDDGVVPTHPRIHLFPYRASYGDYIAFQRSREWDFGLAPLSLVPSNLYKTDNKYREYAAQGIPGIYQDAPPYGDVRDGETGLLAGGSRPWRDAIERYIEDRALRARVRVAARRDAEERRSLENVAPLWERFFTAAPELDAEPGRATAIRRDFDAQPPPLVRVARRTTALARYGVSQVAEHGLLPTIRRTITFVRTRIGGRHRDIGNGEGTP